MTQRQDSHPSPDTKRVRFKPHSRKFPLFYTSNAVTVIINYKSNEAIDKISR